MNACRQTTGIFWGSGCANQFGSMPKLSTWVMQMPLNLEHLATSRTISVMRASNSAAEIAGRFAILVRFLRGIHRRHCFNVSGSSEDDALAEVKRQIDLLALVLTRKPGVAGLARYKTFALLDSPCLAHRRTLSPSPVLVTIGSRWLREQTPALPPPRGR
jgi:hypothetical protein